MSNELNIRQGDIVRIREAAVEAVGEDGTLTLKINMGLGFAHTITTLHRAAIEEILYHSETPEEELERLRAELAKAPRKIEWGGGECPVDRNQWIVAWTRDGDVLSGHAHTFQWTHRSAMPARGGQDVMEYMVLPQ